MAPILFILCLQLLVSIYSIWNILFNVLLKALWMIRITRVKIRQALGPMLRKIACGPLKVTLEQFWGDCETVISPINELKKSVPSKDCEGPQKYDIKGPNDPWIFLLILIHKNNHNNVHVDKCTNFTHIKLYPGGVRKDQ